MKLLLVLFPLAVSSVLMQGDTLGLGCEKNEASCNGTCYDPNVADCLRGQTGNEVSDFLFSSQIVCPLGNKACGVKRVQCYSPETQKCIRLRLESYAFEGQAYDDYMGWTVCPLLVNLGTKHCMFPQMYKI